MAAQPDTADPLAADLDRLERVLKCDTGMNDGLPGPCPMAADGHDEAYIESRGPFDDLHEQADRRATSLTQYAKQLPSSIYAKARGHVADAYQRLSARYGKGMALTIVGAGIIGSAAPVPGSGLVAAAPLIALAEVYLRARAMMAKDLPNFLTRSQGDLRIVAESDAASIAAFLAEHPHGRIFCADDSAAPRRAIRTKALRLRGAGEKETDYAERQRSFLAAAREESVDAPILVIAKNNYFSDCPRDEGGHCKPSGEAGSSEAGSAKPARENRILAERQAAWDDPEEQPDWSREREPETQEALRSIDRLIEPFPAPSMIEDEDEAGRLQVAYAARDTIDEGDAAEVPENLERFAEAAHDAARYYAGQGRSGEATAMRQAALAARRAADYLENGSLGKKMPTRKSVEEEKPANCTCPKYPHEKLRNGSGHQPQCPVHQEWLARGGFQQGKREAEKSLLLHEPEAAGRDPDRLLDLEDIRQEDNYSCGAACAMAVGRYFGAGPDTLEEWKERLGTNEKTSTRPQAIIDYLSSLGLQVEARQDMTIDDLRECWRRGFPVIVPLQEYGVPSKQASYDYGHYCVTVGVAVGQVFVQDPSIDNVFARPGGDVPKGKEDVDADQTPGRMMIDEETWLRVWHDSDADGRKYQNFGIAVGPPAVTTKKRIAPAHLKGQWITLSSKDSAGDKHGSTHVYIEDDGTIGKGPESLRGKRVSELRSSHNVEEIHGRNHPETGTPEGPKELEAKPEPQPEPRHVTPQELIDRAGGKLDLEALGKLNREIRDLEMERIHGGNPSLVDRPELRDKIDALKNERDRLAGVKPGESVNEFQMQQMTAAKNPNKPKEPKKPEKKSSVFS